MTDLRNAGTVLAPTFVQHLRAKAKAEQCDIGEACDFVQAADRIEALEDGLASIRLYANDTLSGRAGGPSDAAWYREGIVELRNRARALLTPEGTDQ